jgi:hypothetical protein
MSLNQNEILDLINQYNSTDRQIIKNNLRRLMDDHNIRPIDIMELGFARNNVYAWTNQTSVNIPLFEQALQIACKWEFTIEEFLK